MCVRCVCVRVCVKEGGVEEGGVYLEVRTDVMMMWCASSVMDTTMWLEAFMRTVLTATTNT